MFWNLLADAAEGTEQTAPAGGIPSYVIWIVLGVILVLFIVYFFFSG